MKNEAQLIASALHGDAAAFGQLVQQYQDRLYTSVVHVVGCREEAEDVVQDAFVRAYTQLDRFRQGSTFYTWLYRIAFNTAINRRRRKRPERSLHQSQQQSGAEPHDPGDGPPDRLLRQERVAQIHQALEMLSEEHRAVLVLRELEGCNYDTIAQVLEISVGTVRSRLHRAREQLREQLMRRHEA